QLVAKLTGFSGRIVWDPSKPDGQPRRMLDTSRAERAFGFVARTPLDEGLRTTVEWYRQGGTAPRSADAHREGSPPLRRASARARRRARHPPSGSGDPPPSRQFAAVSCG